MDEVQTLPKLHRFLVLDTDNRDAMRDVLVNRYGVREFDLDKSTGAFRGVTSYLALKNLDLSYGSLSATVSAKFSGNDLVRQQFVLSGHSQITIGRSRSQVNAGDTALLPAEVDFHCRFRGNFSQLFVRIPEAVLRSKLGGIIGTPVKRSMEFVAGPAAQTPEQLQLRRLVDFFVSELDREDVNIAAPQLAEFEQLLIVSFLKANALNLSDLLTGKVLNAAPWQVRLVEEYIEANWRRSITIEELARETDVGVRNMFLTFKKFRGYAPMAFLRRVRLGHARRMLQAPDAATSVMTISLICGFQNVGHFARYYREAFNELPSVTLAVAKARGA